MHAVITSWDLNNVGMDCELHHFKLIKNAVEFAKGQTAKHIEEWYNGDLGVIEEFSECVLENNSGYSAYVKNGCNDWRIHIKPVVFTDDNF